MIIRYRFDLGGETPVVVTIDLDRASASPADAGAPAWTRLGTHRCPHCPLDPARHSSCPPAADLAPIVGSFTRVISHEQLRVTVELLDRRVEKTVAAQDALSSLMGLVMATSGCPILGRMRGLASTHLPFATPEETLLRVVGAYLIGQWRERQDQGRATLDLDGLRAHYADLEVLNKAFRQRLRSAAREDAALNAISALGVLSLGVGLAIDEALEPLREHAFRVAPPAT